MTSRDTLAILFNRLFRIEAMFVCFHRAAEISSTLIRSPVQTCLLFEESGQKMPSAVSPCCVCTINTSPQAKTSLEITSTKHCAGLGPFS